MYVASNQLGRVDDHPSCREILRYIHSDGDAPRGEQWLLVLVVHAYAVKHDAVEEAYVDTLDGNLGGKKVTQNVGCLFAHKILY